MISVLLSLVVASSVSVSATAAGCTDQIQARDSIVLRATGHFDIDVPAKTLRKAGTSFSMEYGETVTIKASYTPFSANVDFGLIDSKEISTILLRQTVVLIGPSEFRQEEVYFRCTEQLFLRNQCFGVC